MILYGTVFRFPWSLAWYQLTSNHANWTCLSWVYHELKQALCDIKYISISYQAGNLFVQNLSMLMAKKMVLVLLLAIAFMTKSAEAQLPDCYFQEVNLVPCLTVGTAGNTTEVCCQALNQALSIGQKCACSIMFSTNLFLDSRNPVPTSPHGIELPGCNLFMPSLSACQG